VTTTRERRTQAQRREGTIGALLEATVTCLTERGYAATSTAAVCAEAGVSQGALFRHFPTRQALLVATAEHVATRNVAAFRALGDRGRGSRLVGTDRRGAGERDEPGVDPGVPAAGLPDAFPERSAGFGIRRGHIT
jgi:AcrR family transcriptional regulator